MRALLRGLTILLPLVGLAYCWQTTRQSAAEGVEWDVAVTGYDPRDLLRGHYVRFTYVWPEDPLIGTTEGNSPATRLCIEGEAPSIRRATRLMTGDDASACNGIASTPLYRPGTVQAGTVPIEGRLFIPQAQGPQMEKALNDPKQQASLRFRLKRNGEIVPIRLSFTPKPPISH